MTQEEENKQQIILTVAHTDHEKGLNQHAFFKVHDNAIGEDLVQDTFMKTWKFIVKGGASAHHEGFSISHFKSAHH